ncbi:MAG: ERF family protein [Pelagibacterales bacterium]|nr:ERF family protein [Pelagibacterales bacterium]
MTKQKRTLHEVLGIIQIKLKVHKGQMNNFGGYKYRSAEDILEAVKPFLSEYGLTLTFMEQIMELTGQLFVYTEATLSDGEDNFIAVSQAGIDCNRKGMDVAQSFGASSSYAKKYALGNLFLLDDTKDADATNSHGKEASKKPKPVKKANPVKEKMTPEIESLMMEAVEKGNIKAVKDRMGYYTMTKAQRDRLEKAVV